MVLVVLDEGEEEETNSSLLWFSTESNYVLHFGLT